MIPFFPKHIATKAFTMYAVALLAVSVLFARYSMQIEFIILGVVEVAVFFFLSARYTQEWQVLPEKAFVKKLFWIAFGIRSVWVIFSYFFYKWQTGVPFEFSAADSMAYHGDAEWLAGEPLSTMVNYLFTSRPGYYSDSGYLVYLTLLYKVVGTGIIPARIAKSAISALTCVLIYRLASRTFNEKVGRMAGIFSLLMPNLIIYCGLHLKETEMVFLCVAFLERADYLLRSKKYNVITIATPILLAASLFLFRTVLGVVTFFSLVTALVFYTSKVVGKAKRAMLIGWTVLAIVIFAGGTIINEVESVWENRGENQAVKREQQTLRGNQWAKYATGTVMAPMMFVLPFPTMVDVAEQHNQEVMHGGNFVRNFFGIFVIIAIYTAFFVKKNWRNLTLIGAFVVGYLGVVSMSGFANSERFLLPGLPVLLILAAYGMSELTARTYKWVTMWYYVVVVMALAWAFFKVGSRGMF